jgi:tetratricopeptide (TPR) repeat protein
MSDESTQSPREFLRARRPEYFSDSEANESALLNRPQLEYHLATLTKRNQEYDFEVFARKLAEREICPNLLPNTGPTGGGDSKADTETFPVADQLSLGWFSGIGREASGERWAFAFSAKTQWQGKVRDDVRKIAGTGRGYRKAFFISNQYVRSKNRAKFEDKLTKEFGLEVRILDLTWILDSVFSHKREALAIEHLRLQVSVLNATKPGPHDTRRESELNELDRRIQEEVGEPKQQFRLVEDCIRSAELARALEKPRVDIDGRFARAKAISEKCGAEGQRIECAYEWARTAYWWYEDYPLFATAYAEVQQLCANASSPHELEQLKTLWFLLMSSVARGYIEADAVSIASRTDFLKDKFLPLSLNKERPSIALYAETQLLEIELMLSLKTGTGVPALFGKLEIVLSDCAGLVGYPFERVARIITENGDVFQEFEGYTELFDTVVDITTKRRSDVEAGRLLIMRGRQLRDAGQPYDAIAAFGKALGKVYKRETRLEAIRALYFSATCYENVGLFWAARGTLLTAESLADNEFSETGKVLSIHTSCSRLFKWIELRLGRVPQALAWHRYDYLLRKFLESQGDNSDRLEEIDQQFDVGAGALLLRSEATDLSHLTCLPKLLSVSYLPVASDCILFILGHENEIAMPEKTDEAIPSLDKLMHQVDAMVGDELPERPAYFEQANIGLESHLLGCRVEVSTRNTRACIGLAESILAALESFLSTTSVALAMAKDPVFRIDVSESPSLSDPFAWKIEEKGGRPLVLITSRALVDTDLLPANQSSTKSALAELLLDVVVHFITAENPREVLDTIVKKEIAFSRAIDFTGFHVAVENITDLYFDRISACCDGSLPEYKAQRDPAWQSGKWREHKAQDAAPKEFRAGAMPQHLKDKLFDRRTAKQSEIQTLSLIRIALWDKAIWQATAYVCPPDRPPALVCLFREKGPAIKIIQGLTEDLTTEDKKDGLRVTIIRGIDRANPHHYRIVLTSNMTGLKSGAKFFSTASKSITMTPSSDVLSGHLKSGH